MTRDSLFAEARATPLTRGAIEELAKRAPIELVIEHAPAAIEAGPHVATVLASVIVASGRKLSPAFARALLTELDGVALFGPIVFATDGDRVAMLAEFLEDAHASWERETLALFLAAESLGGERDTRARETIVVHARRLSRNELEGDSAILLGATALRIGDEDLVKLAAPFVTKAKKQKRVAEQALAEAKRPLLDALAEAAPRVVGGDYTVRKAGPDVGRNDPCPCGSGKKYKKCCALKPAAPEASSFEPPRIDEATLHPEQARELRASELARLDLTRVPSRALPWVYRRALVFKRWAFAEQVLDVMAGRADQKDKVESLRLEMLDHALDARDAAAAEATLAKLGAARVPAALTLDLACVRGDAGAAALEEAAKIAVRTENEGVDAVELAFVLLRNFPALGILAARGALHEGRPDDSKALLQAMEDARDRAMLPPFEPWWELYDALVAEARDRKKARLSEAEREQMAKEVRRARAESRGAAAEVEKMRRRLEALDAALSAKPLEVAPTSKPEMPAKPSIDSAELEEERRRLRMKVDELQRIIGEGQHERRELRQQLSVLAEQRAASAPARAEEREDEEAGVDAGDVEERPRGILVPVYSDRAARSVTELDEAPAEAALALVAALAAGRENAWGGVKRLTKARSVYSARAGIHHRILFGVDEKTLRVHDVIHRRDLEQAVNRLVRA